MSSTAEAQTAHRSDRDKRLERVEGRLSRFIVAHPNVTKEGYRSESGRRQILNPPLWEQLLASVEPARTTGAAGGYRSQPPANLHAIDVQQMISRQVCFWFTGILFARVPSSTKAGMEQLKQRAPGMADEHLWGLDDDTRRWAGMAYAVSGYSDPPRVPHVPCINCEMWDTLRVHAEPMLNVYCTNCHEVWDDSTRGLLARYYKNLFAEPAAVVDADTPEGEVLPDRHEEA